MLETGLENNHQAVGPYGSGGEKLITATSWSEATSKGIENNSMMQAQSHEFGSTHK